MARHDLDSATLIEQDRQEALRLKNGPRPQQIMPQEGMFADKAELDDAQFSDPGKKYASIRNPKVYEALKRKGYSKSKSARISNAKKRK